MSPWKEDSTKMTTGELLPMTMAPTLADVLLPVVLALSRAVLTLDKMTMSSRMSDVVDPKDIAILEKFVDEVQR